ncbi:MAG: serine hydrolase domain-containing protein [Candidatus Aminicenantaceae bacterium]
MKTIRATACALLLYLCCVGAIPAQRIPEAEPAAVGMSRTQLERLDQVMAEALEKRAFPGAVIVVGREGKIVFRKAYGASQWLPDLRPMRVDLVFDMASLTKPMATTTAIMLLLEQGRLRLWDKVSDFIPGFRSFRDEEGKKGEDIRIWHLLTHTSGLLPFLRNEEIEESLGIPCALTDMVSYIADLDKLFPAGEEFLYSDLDFIILGFIVESVSGQTLAEFCRDHIFSPLKMEHTLFNPPESLHARCVPTEVVDGELLRGVVHDPRARLLGGVAGHAGLFSTADDLSVFAQMLLGGGEFGGVRILSPLSVARMTEVYPHAAFAGRGLGWDLDSDFSTNSGDLFGPASFGHTGYTGTSLWVDPETRTFVIFLTNRVHPDDTGDVATWRSRVANVVAASIRE